MDWAPVRDRANIELRCRERFQATLKKIEENGPDTTVLDECGYSQHIQDITDEQWQQLGHIISNNTHLTTINFRYDALNDHKASFFFRGLTRSSSITRLDLSSTNTNVVGDTLSVVGVRSMVPFLQNANNLQTLDLCWNNLQSEGFNVLFRALSDSPIETLKCCTCGIESIEIDTEHAPKNLMHLNLNSNNINADGCCELAKLLQGGDATLTELHLGYNEIDDEGVTILVEALQSNKSLTKLDLFENEGVSDHGKIKLLKLVNDISSIKAILQSNHTLNEITFYYIEEEEDWEEYEDDEIQMHINMATGINRNSDSPEAAGREKVIQTQLNSVKRAELAKLQGVTSSVFSEIDPLHLPEFLALVGRHHDQRDMYVALKSSIAGVISTVNREQYLKQQRAELKARLEAIQDEISTIDAELVNIEASELPVKDIGSEPCSNKRRRAS